MLGYSNTKNELFIFPGTFNHILEAKIKIETKLLKLNELTLSQWKQLRQLQGKFTTFYLKLRYGSQDTYILLAFAKDELVHTEWIIPAYKIKSRYNFLSDNSYAIISCLTAKGFRGKGIYPSQIQRVLRSNILSKGFMIWAASENTPSLAGIKKAGGIKVGEFIHTRLFWGAISRSRYFAK